MDTNTKKSATQTKATPKSEPESSGMVKMIQDNTPPFVSKNIISASSTLEAFRINYFNSIFIFYPVLGILVFFILRYFYRKLF